MARTYLLALLFASACAADGSSTGPDYAGPGGDDSMDPGSGNGSGDTTGSGGSTGGGGGGSTTPVSAGPYFSQPMFWNRDVTGVAKASNSDSILSTLSSSGGWGTGRMQIDFAIDVLTADASTPKRSFTTTEDFYSPDCDHVPVPVPAGGNVEDESGYACTGGGDCHLIVNDTSSHTLYEMWRANITSTFEGGCLAVWNTQQAYSDTLRGDQCTSADAAGFPITPLLFTADEVAAGHIDHAIRFILPNARMRRGFYVHPATHAGGPSADAAEAPVYGTRWRLRSDYPLDSLPNDGARVVARALQQYGMALADGGNIALTARSDRSTTAQWDGLLGPRDLAAIQPNDFEVVDTGAPIELTYDCARSAY